MTGLIGIIANPASGKDIRRLVAHGSVFENHEKINIIRRVLRGLDALGIRHVLAMGDAFGLITQARDGLEARLTVETLDLPITNTAQDSTEAARRMAAAGAGCIITLGGDGTNRAVAKGCGYVPLVPISTGTNNAFPAMVEGTLAGIAAAVVALNPDGVRAAAVRLTRRVDVLRNGERVDLALIDVIVSSERFVASRAIWTIDSMRAVVVSGVRPGTIGASAIAGFLPEASRHAGQGAWIEVGPGGRDVFAPIAPGLIERVPVRSVRWLAVGERVVLPPLRGVLALDGERDLQVAPEDHLEFALTQDGPQVVDIGAALRWASQAGFFVRRCG